MRVVQNKVEAAPMCPLGPVRAAAAAYGRLIDVPVSRSIRCRKVAFSAACCSKSCCKASTSPQCRCCSVLNCAGQRRTPRRACWPSGRSGSGCCRCGRSGACARTRPRLPPRSTSASASVPMACPEQVGPKRNGGERPSQTPLRRRSASRAAIQCLAGEVAQGGLVPRIECRRRRVESWLSDAQPLQVLDRSPHLAGVPRRPVVALWQTLNAGAPPHGDQLDCEMLRAVVLAQGKEPLRHCNRWKLVHGRIG